MDWQKQHSIYERKAYRIVQKHISAIIKRLPKNASLYTYEVEVDVSIMREDILKMYRELYQTIGIDYGNKINKTLEKTKKANVLFNNELLKEILLFLSSDGGVRITSVRDTLVADVIKSIQKSLGENGTVIDLRNAIQSIIEKNQTFYKWQSLRIARTETTTASNFAAIKTAEQSDLVLDKVWISVQDNRTRRKIYDHFDMNNQKQELNKPFFVGGENIRYPGDAKASAGNTSNCRCAIAFVPKRDADGMLILKNKLEKSKLI